MSASKSILPCLDRGSSHVMVMARASAYNLFVQVDVQEQVSAKELMNTTDRPLRITQRRGNIIVHLTTTTTKPETLQADALL